MNPVKILERGDKWKNITCGKCTSKLEIDAYDIRFLGNLSEEDNYSEAYCCYCPVCKNSIPLYGIPEYVVDKVRIQDYDF